MKRRSVLISLISLSGTLLFAQAIDKQVAMVRLTRAETITVRQVRKTVDPLEQRANRALTKDERKQVLEGFIARALIEQAAERDKVYVSDAELKTEVERQKKALGAQLKAGRDLTDAELQTLIVQNSGTTWDEFLKALKYSQLTYKYAAFKHPDAFSKIPETTDADAKAYYDANKTKYFVWDDTVHMKWILIDTRNLTSKDERDKAAKRADDVYKEFKSGAKFDELVARYSDDTTSKYKGGEMGWLQRNDTTQQQLLGTAFFDSVFALKKGETSGIIQTNVGYAIVQVTDRIDAKILGLEDKIPPNYTEVVKDRVKALLLQNRQTEAYTKTLTDIIADLKKQAEVKVFEENLSW
jgi:parvulin-like peptidyl-prolyl isomerase